MTQPGAACNEICGPIAVLDDAEIHTTVIDIAQVPDDWPPDAGRLTFSQFKRQGVTAIPVALLGVELHRKTPDIEGEVRRTFDPATVENRTKVSVSRPTFWSGTARVICDMSRVHSQVPCVPNPRAWTILSGILSWSK